MPAPYGIVPTGFSSKTLEETKLEIENEERANISASLNTSDVTPIGQLNGIFASKLREVWELAQAAYDSFDPEAASGDALTALALITGTRRRGETKSLVFADVDLDAGTYAAGSLIASVLGNPEARFANVNEIVSSGGLNAGEVFEAETAGPVQALAGTLTVVTPVTGWNSVTNPADATEGENVETDVALRLRRETELAQSGASTVDAIRADVAQVGGVLAITVFENTSLLTDSDGLPGKSFEVVVFDGAVPAADDDEIAQAIWESKPAGILSYGQTNGVATDTEGVEHTLGFTRVEVLDVWLEFDLTVDALSYAGDAAVAAAVAAFGDANLTNGGDVILSRLCTAIFGVGGVLDIVATRAGFAVSPVGTINLAVGARQIADLDTARIVVNS